MTNTPTPDIHTRVGIYFTTLVGAYLIYRALVDGLWLVALLGLAIITWGRVWRRLAIKQAVSHPARWSQYD